MIKSYNILSILITITLLLTCGKAPDESELAMFEDFTEASLLHVTPPGAFAFGDDDSWDSFCDQYWSGDDPGVNIPRPEVDFESDMIIGVFWGPTGGCYSWVDCIRAVFIRPDVIDIHISSLPDLGDCEMIVWPMQVIIMERHDLPVEFHGHVPGNTE